MSDLRLERSFAVAPETLFTWITAPDKLVQWFGPEGVDLTDHQMDFTRTGPWVAVMVGRESGQRFKVSGHVTHVDPPRSVGFTWGWHDDADQRGDESHVTLSVTATDGGAQLVLDHRDLTDAEAAQNHRTGWVSTLRKLEKLVVS